MQIQIHYGIQAYGSRFAREPDPPTRTGVGRRYPLEGDARPGDVLALAGGALVRDLNANGLADGYDAPLDDRAPALRGTLLDVRG